MPQGKTLPFLPATFRESQREKISLFEAPSASHIKPSHGSITGDCQLIQGEPGSTALLSLEAHQVSLGF